MYSINRYTFVSAMKRRSAQMDTLRAKRFRAESIYLIFQNIQQRTEYSHLGLNLGLQSMNSAQMSNRNNLSCGMYGVCRTKDESAQSSPRSQYERG